MAEYIQYEELRIRLWAVGNDRYLIFANGPAAALDIIRLPDPQRFMTARNTLLEEEFQLKKKFGDGDQPSDDLSAVTRLRELGRELFICLFREPIAHCLQDSLDFARVQGRHLRLRFYLDDALMDLPLEILCTPVNHPLKFLGFLALKPDLSIMRSLAGGEIGKGRRLTHENNPEPLNILVAIATPSDYEPIDAMDEVRKIEKACTEEEANVKTLLHATEDNLKQEVEALQRPSVVVIIAHGNFDDQHQCGVVMLEDERGDAVKVTGDHLGGLLRGAPFLRLVVLNLCHGAQTARQEPYSGIAQSMIAAGIPAVVAMQYAVSDTAAGRCSPTIIDALRQNHALDIAVGNARGKMGHVEAKTYDDSTALTTIEWCTPACILSDAFKGAWLFQVTVPNPLTISHERLKKLRRGSLKSEEVIRDALRHARIEAEWSEVCKDYITARKFSSKDPVLERILHEAKIEQSAELLQKKICASLQNIYANPANGAQIAAVRQLLEQVKQLPWMKLRGLPALGDLPAFVDEVALPYETYQTARRHEQDEAWEEAEKAYLEVAFQDRFDGVLERATYCRARREEDQERWKKATEGFEAVTGYSDAARRHLWCRGRAAEERAAKGQTTPEEALAAFGDLPDTYEDIKARRAYWSGRSAEEQGKWKAAESFFARASQDLYPDAPDRKENCRQQGEAQQKQWREAFVQGRALEEAGRWSAALEAYGLLAEDYREVGYRRKRLRLLLEQISWLDGLAHAGFASDPLCSKEETSPYRLLAPLGITPNSPHKDVLEASFVLMEQGRMSSEMRLAWDQVRVMARRLQVDALLYPIRDPKTLLRQQSEMQPGAAVELVESLCRASPVDAPLFRLLSGQREEAVAQWQKRLDDHIDTVVIHALALASMFSAQKLEARAEEEKAAAARECAIGCWTVTLHDDGYWAMWRNVRSERYCSTVSDNDVARLRSHLYEWALQQLECSVDSQVAEGAQAQAVCLRNMAWEAEWEGARALKVVGGLPLQGVAQTLCCGRRFLRMRHLGLTLGQWVERLEHQSPRPESEEILDIAVALNAVIALSEERLVVTPEALYRLRCAFSPLSEAFALSERGWLEEALKALPQNAYALKPAELPSDCHIAGGTNQALADNCPTCRKFEEEAPAYLCLLHRRARMLQDAVKLVVEIHLTWAQIVLTARDGDPDEVFEHWKQAIEIAHNVGTQVRTKQAITGVVKRRVAALESERSKRRGDRLTQAIRLIERARALLGGAGDELRQLQSDLLTARVIWHSSSDQDLQPIDNLKAADEFRQALLLDPTSMKARDNLARALVFHAQDMYARGRLSSAWEAVTEAFRTLDEGMRHLPSHPSFRETLKDVLSELESLSLAAKGDQARVERLVRALGDAVYSYNAAREEGRFKLDRGEISGAILAFVEAVRLAPQEEATAARGALLTALERRIGEARDKGEDPR